VKYFIVYPYSQTDDPKTNTSDTFIVGGGIKMPIRCARKQLQLRNNSDAGIVHIQSQQPLGNAM